MEEPKESLASIDLYNILQDSGRSVLLIDLRSLQSFKDAAIRNGHNVTFQTPLKNVEDLLEAECTKYQWEEEECTLKDARKEFRFRKVGIYQYLIAYDEEGGEESKHFAKLIREEGKMKPQNVFYLEGGFKKFQAEYPFLISSLESKKKAMEGLMPTELVPQFLYIGSNENATNMEHLKVLGITHVLNMADELENSYPPPITYFHCGMNDTLSESKFDDNIHKALDFISKAQETPNSKILVHCAMGISRASATCIGWLMKSKQWGFDEAKQYVKAQRACINPNKYFVSRLQGGILSQ